jgi:hypothetical protein
MPYEQHQEKSYPLNAQTVYQAALKVTEKLSGKVIASNPEKFRLEVNFPKVVLGKTLGERTYFAVEIRPEGEGCQVVLDSYPLDALNRKLMFGARKGVTQTLVLWFTAHLENTLGILEQK